MNSEYFSQAPATLVLIGVTVVISLLGWSRPSWWRYMALEPHHMWINHQYHAIVTSGFLHGDGMHLLFNMLTMLFFGVPLEVTVGSQNLLLIYFISLIGGNLYPYFKYRKQVNYVAIGASGAVSGVLFSFILFYPLTTIYLFFSLPMPAALYAVLYVGYSIYAMRNRNDNVGHEAHLAGAGAGIVATVIVVPQVIEIIANHF